MARHYNRNMILMLLLFIQLALSAEAIPAAKLSNKQQARICTIWHREHISWRTLDVNEAKYQTSVIVKYLSDSLDLLANYDSKVLKHRLRNKSMYTSRSRYAPGRFGFKKSAAVTAQASSKILGVELDPVYLASEMFHNAATAAFLMERLLNEEVMFEVPLGSVEFAKLIEFTKESQLSVMHHLHHFLHKLGHRFSWLDLDNYEQHFNRIISLLPPENRELRYLRDYLISSIVSESVSHSLAVIEVIRNCLQE